MKSRQTRRSKEERRELADLTESIEKDMEKSSLEDKDSVSKSRSDRNNQPSCELTNLQNRQKHYHNLINNEEREIEETDRRRSQCHGEK